MMLKSSFEGKVTLTKKKGQLYVLSVKTGRDVLKCLTSVDVTQHGIEKGTSLYIEGYYSITNALFPIINLYKIVNDKKIAISIEEKHFYEQIETMPPMTKKKRGKDGTFPVPETLTRENVDESRTKVENFGINIPTLDPDKLVSKTKPVSTPKSKKVSKPPVKETVEEIVDEKKEVKEITHSTPKTELPAEETEIVSNDNNTVEENLFDINIPDIMAELEDEKPPVSVIEESTETENVETKAENSISPEELPPVVEKKETTPVKTVQFDDDFGLPVPTFLNSAKKVTAPAPVPAPQKKVVANEETPIVKKEVPSTQYAKPTPAPAKKVPPAKTVKETQPVAVEKVSTSSKFPVKFSSADLM